MPSEYSTLYSVSAGDRGVHSIRSTGDAADAAATVCGSLYGSVMPRGGVDVIVTAFDANGNAGKPVALVVGAPSDQAAHDAAMAARNAAEDKGDSVAVRRHDNNATACRYRLAQRNTKRANAGQPATACDAPRP
jgi:hypothetical protein